MRALLGAAIALSFGSLASGQAPMISCNPMTGPTTAGVMYSATCTVSGTAASYTWSPTSAPPLPDGLTLTPSSDTTMATIAGTPTTSGPYNYTVQATDNTTGLMSNPQNYAGTIAPSVTSISPISATAGGPGFTLTVNGAGFGADSMVNFNGPLTPSSITPTQLMVTVPMASIMTPGTVQVTVTSGGATSSPSLPFTIVPPPMISSINPTSTATGSAAFTLTVNGSGFGVDSMVNFGSNTLAPSSINASQVTVSVPASLLTNTNTVQVTVTSGGVTSNSATFTIAAPATTSIDPTTVTAGGSSFLLTVNGSNFGPNATIQWTVSGTITTLTTNDLSSSELTTTVPSNLIGAPGSAQIAVKSGNATSNAQTLTIVAGPALGSISPDTITAGTGSFTLTANGTGFASGAVVQWNGSPLSTTFQSSNQLTATVPSTLVASLGSASVTVQSGGVTSNALTFTIVAAPTISTLSPNTITAGSAAFDMTVNGSGFASGAQVKWNGNPIGTVFVSSSQLTATVPASDVAGTGTDHVTVTSGGVTSSPINFTVVAGPAITSLSPNSATAGGPAFTLTVNGTGFASGASVLWNATSLSNSFRSATQLIASVPANLIASAGTASISVKSGGVTSNSVSFTVNSPPPALSIISISPTSITGGTGAGLGAVGSCPARVNPAGTLTVDGTGFSSSSTVDWNGQAMVTNFVSSTQLTACVSLANIQGYGTAAITVVSGNTKSNAVNISLLVPAISITGLNTTSAPTQQLQVGVQLASATPVALQGTVQLSFSSTAPGLPAGYVDPGLQFSTGQTSATFSIGAGSNSARVAALQQGTVEGTIAVTLMNLTANGVSVLPSSTVIGTVTIPPLPPVITAGSVQITNLSSSGFDVVLTGYSDTRDMTTATFTFTPASGSAFSGTTTFAVPVSSVFTSWFDSAAGQQNGSMFLLTVPFTISGPTSVLGSVSVTLTNSVGTSAPASASP
jgi:hypothetical protein